MAEWIIYITEIVGTVAFAASGAMIGIKRKLDLFGVVFIALITSFGGGAIRDVCLGHFPPRMFYNFEFLAIAVAVSLIVFLITYLKVLKRGKHSEFFDVMINVIDAFGLAAFSISGVQVALAAGYEKNAVLCVIMGMVTGVGGGILRDAVTQTIPYVFQKHVYAIASIAGSLLFYLLVRLDAHDTVASFVSIGVIVIIRILAARYKWSLPRIKTEDGEASK
jgi:uncharacterized membrane protein YeiH